MFPTYDTYAAPLLAGICAPFERPVLVDIGANVGDTVLMATSAVPQLAVIAVEGDPGFLAYLERNIRPVADRVRVVDAFVATVSTGPLTYSSDGSTGGFRATRDGDSSPGVAVADLMDQSTADLIVWKSDTDGLDVTILLENWSLIDERCGVIWFELDPALDVEQGRRIPELLAHIAAAGRSCVVFDNMGVFAAQIEAHAVVDVLAALLASRHERGVAYYDVWAYDTARVTIPLDASRSAG